MASSNVFMRETFKKPACECYCLSVLQSETRPLMAASFTDLTTKIWDINQILNEGIGLDKPSCVIKDSVELAPVEVALIGSRLAASSIDGTIRIYDVNSPEDGSDITVTKKIDSNNLEYNADENEMQIDQAADLLDLGTSTIDPYRFCFNPKDKDQILTGQLNLQVVQIQSQQKNLSMKYQFQDDSKNNNQSYINCMDWSPDGKFIAQGDIDGQSKIFQVNYSDFNNKEQNKLQATLNTHGRGVKAIKFSPDSSQLVTGGEDLHIHLVDVETQQRLLTLVNHADWITSITFCPSDPKYFASTSLDGIVKIWQYGVNKEVKSIDLSGHGGVWKAEFTQDGQYICVCCQDGTIGLIHFVNQ